MNTLIACRHDPEAVEAAGEGLAGYLRYALDRRSGELEPLGVQLEALSNYINVEELRFGEQLQCRIHVDPQLLSVSVPRFLLQPLVENALKFGQASSSAPLQLQVINTGRLGEPPGTGGAGVGYGLDSLRQRLQLHYGSRASLSLQASDTTVSAVVQLPMPSR